MLKIHKLNIITNTNRILLKDFSFTLNPNDKIALIGEEGNGKSTILKIIAGIDVSSYVSFSGTITADGIVAYLPQTIEDKYLDLIEVLILYFLYELLILFLLYNFVYFHFH